MKSPKIRFKEFQNEWNSRILGEVCNKFDNLRIPIAENLRKKGNIPYYGANGIQDYVDGYTHDGEFVLIAEDGANDIKNYPVQYVNGKIWVNNHAHVLQGKNGILNNIFLNYSISSINFEPFLVGGGRAKLNASVLDNFIFRIPSDIKEQEKIGEFFRKIDGILDLENSRFKKLENFKKTMLDKLFVKDGADEPQIRLGSFKGKWNSRILGDICEYRRGSFPQPYGLKQWYDKNGNPFVQVFDVGENFKLKDKTKSNISKLAEPMSVFIPKGSLIVTLQGSIGRVAITHYDAFLDRTLLYFQKFNIKIDLYFFQYVLFLLFQQERQKAPGGTIKTITKEALSSFKIRIPNDIKEQEKIGEFFRKIDGILEFSQKKITKLENIKKYLLNKMFV